MSITEFREADLSGRALISDAVGIGRGKASLADRAFAWVFSGLVYPQIWEDPEVDMAAMDIRPGHRIVTIASGGCNALSYLLADPGSVEAVDLNTVHVAFNRLKKTALLRLPGYEAFYRFFGRGDDRQNLIEYERYLSSALDADTRAYWNGREFGGSRRISLFTRGLYRRGLLGRFIGVGHFLARLHCIDLAEFLKLDGIEAQREWFERRLAPVFDRPVVRFLSRSRASLFGLGIPPRQYEALAGGHGAAGQGAAGVLKERLRRLTCDFPLSENYFAWQAFGRGYAAGVDGPLPPYLERRNWETLKARADRVSVVHASFSEHLSRLAGPTYDAYVLLDAQDWMTDAQLTTLWSEIVRTAKPGCRVIFRTAGEDTILPGRVPQAILGRFRYDAEQGRAFTERDRSSIYGGFHLYTFEG